MIVDGRQEHQKRPKEVSDLTEEQALRQMQQGAQDALAWFIHQYGAYVSTIIHNIIGQRMSNADVEEVASDVFLALWTHAGELDPEKGLRPWLGTVARNKAVDRLRRAGASLPLPEEVPAPGPGPQEAAERMEQAEVLWRAVEALGEPDTTLFLRYYYYGDKLGDIAAALGLKLPAARARLSRGRKKLKLLLTEGGDALWTQG